jgi:hypothetical protein
LEVSVHAIGYPPLYRGEWELRLNGTSGAKSSDPQAIFVAVGSRIATHEHCDNIVLEAERLPAQSADKCEGEQVH